MRRETGDTAGREEKYDKTVGAMEERRQGEAEDVMEETRYD